MDVIEHAREIGRLIQADDRYVALKLAQQASDEDGDLQKLIGDFNLKRLAINNESTAEQPDNEKLAQYNRELREVYAQIMSNEHMKAYEAAKNALDALTQRVQAIILKSIEGEDPDTADYTEAQCGGDCGHCSGCH